MSLAYTTLLSLVPLMVFSFAILKGLGARGDLKFILHEFFRARGRRGDAADRKRHAIRREHARRTARLDRPGISRLHRRSPPFKRWKRASISYGACERPRSFGRRFTEYLSVMILGPILLAVALGLLGSRRAQPVRAVARRRRAARWSLGRLGQIVPYAIVTIVFTLHVRRSSPTPMCSFGRRSSAA